MSLGKLRFLCWDKGLSIGKIAFLRGETKQVSCAFLVTKPRNFFQASRIGRQTILGKFDWPACRLQPAVSHPCTRVTHTEDQPFCHAFHSPYTVKHVLIKWSDFLQIRNKLYTMTNMPTLFFERLIPWKLQSISKTLDYYDKMWSLDLLQNSYK